MLNGLMRILGRAGLGVGLASVVAALIPTRGSGRRPGALGSRRPLDDPARLLPGRHLRARRRPLLRRHQHGPLPEQLTARRGGPERERDPLRGRDRRAATTTSATSPTTTADGGRILLPLECYYPGTPGGANTCQTGSIGVADPDTLQWQYYVKLDPASHQEGDVGGGLARRQRALDPAGQRPARLRHERHQRCERRPVAAPSSSPSQKLDGCGPPERHHRGHLLPRPPLRGRIDGRPRRQPRRHVPGLVDRPGGRHAGGWRSSARSPASPRASTYSARSEGSSTGRSSRSPRTRLISPRPTTRASAPCSASSRMPSAGDISDSDDDGVVDATDECDHDPGGNEDDGCPALARPR